jgi:hypothetical protein
MGRKRREGKYTPQKMENLVVNEENGIQFLTPTK